MIRALTIVTCVLLDRLETIEERVERLRVSHGCAGDACAVCSLLDDIDAAFDSHGLAACLTRSPALAPRNAHWVVGGGANPRIRHRRRGLRQPRYLISHGDVQGTPMVEMWLVD
jgi:hypothetical protein